MNKVPPQAHAAPGSEVYTTFRETSVFIVQYRVRNKLQRTATEWPAV